MVKNRFIRIFKGFIIITLTLSCLLSFSFFNPKENIQRQKMQLHESQIHSSETDILAYPGNQTREIPLYHIFMQGDTIPSIAALYDESIAKIIRFNKISDKRTIKPGDYIYLPTGIKNLRQISYPEDIYKQITPLPHIITIRSFITRGKIPLSIDFATLFDFPDTLSPLWDFGTGEYSTKEYASYTYLKSGEYPVTLFLANETGQEISSNTLIISVENENINSDSDIFFTLDYVGDTLDLSNRYYDNSGNPIELDSSFAIKQYPRLLQYKNVNRFISIAPGYAKIILVSNTYQFHFYLFVSPFPSKHSVEPEYYWYKTQFDTGMYGNCGPACVAMAVHWATGQNISVIESRREIGLPIASGAVSLDHMAQNFRFHRIKTYDTIVNEFKDVKAIIDKGNIAIILFNTTYIQPVEGDKTVVFVDRYYPDTTGHYVVIKGYSLDEKYFIVYDPIPGDWLNNSPRYTDGVSMIGRNRYFLADQIFASIKGKRVLEIERKRGKN